MLFPHAKQYQSFCTWIWKAGVECFDSAFFLFLPRLLFFLFLFSSVILVFDGIAPSSRHAERIAQKRAAFNISRHGPPFVFTFYKAFYIITEAYGPPQRRLA